MRNDRRKEQGGKIQFLKRTKQIESKRSNSIFTMDAIICPHQICTHCYSSVYQRITIHLTRIAWCGGK